MTFPRGMLCGKVGDRTSSRNYVADALSCEPPGGSRCPWSSATDAPRRARRGARLRLALAPGSRLETRKTRFLVIPQGLLDIPLGDRFPLGVKLTVY